MVDLWMPGVQKYRSSRNNGSMDGGKPRATWHVTVNDPNTTSAMDVATYINTRGYPVHLIWHPITGDIIQAIPANLGGLGLERNSSEPTNSKGKYNIQIEVVAKATKPFTDYPCKGLDRIMDWLRSLGIPDKWPGGAPLAYGKNGEPAYGANNGNRTLSAWQLGGHFGHSQVPLNSHGDPGAIDIKKIFAAGTKPKPVPLPVPEGKYRVVAGDTLWGISHKFNVTVDDLRAWNGLKTDVLSIGQVLSVVKVKPVIHLANLKYGKRNNDVKKLQRTLIARGWHIPSGVTGYFGDETKAAVRKFQLHQGWTGSDADGIPGRQSLEKMGFDVE